MASILDSLKRLRNQAVLSEADDRFWRKYGYVFELRSPGVPGGSMYFVLALGPSRYSFREEYAQEVTLTQGGIFTEEHGIVLGKVSLSAHEGFGLRKSRDTIQAVPEAGVGLKGVTTELSGHSRFLRLRDGIFRAYSALKRTKHATETYLILHVLKDNDHWIVVPESFELDRDSSRHSAVHPFNISLTVVGRAGEIDISESEDKNFFDSWNDKIRQLRRAVTDITATVREANAVLYEARLVVSNAQGILTDASSLADSVSDTINTAELTISAATVGTMRRLAITIESTLRAFSTAANFPPNVQGLWAQVEDEANRIKARFDPGDETSWFETEWREIKDRWERLVNDKRRTVTRSRLEAADAAGPVTTSTELRSTAPRAGDLDRVDLGGLQTKRLSTRYVGWFEHTLRVGDTIEGLAAEYLGDARKWTDIAILNNLRHPYLSDASLPRTLGVGKKILIPSTDRSQIASAQVAANPSLGSSQRESFYGRDLRLHKSEGIAIDTRHDSEDFELISGESNMAQAVYIKLTTRRGENVLYRRLGLDLAVGEPNEIESLAAARLKVEQAILPDPRVDSVSRVDFDVDGDTLTIDLDVALRNAETMRTAQRIVV